MKLVLRILKVILWAEGLLLLLGFTQLIAGMIGSPGEVLAQKLRHPLLGGLLLLLGALGPVCLIAAWALSARKPWAWKAGLAASILNILFIPVGTVIGALGLVAFLSHTGRRLFEAKPERTSSTPIPRASPVFVTISVAALGLTYWLGWTLIDSGRQAGVPTLPLWANLLAIPACVFAATAIHELGHLAAGWAVGFRFALISIGPVLLMRRADGWKFGWYGQMGWTGGYAGATVSDLHLLRARRMIFAAGGPLANLAGVPVFLCLYFLGAGRSWGWSGDLSLTLALISLYLFLLSAIPLESEGFETDGKSFLSLLLLNPAGKRTVALSGCLLSDTQLLRPKDWPSQWVKDLLADPDGSRRFQSACYMAYLHHLDRAELSAASGALAHLERLMAGNNAGFDTRPYAMELAYFEARHRGNAATARKWLSVGSDGVEAERFVELRAQAAVLLAEGRSADAYITIQLARQILGECARTGFTDLDRSLLDDLAAMVASSSLEALRQATTTTKPLPVTPRLV